MNKREQRENLTRAKVLLDLIQKHGLEEQRVSAFQEFVISCHNKNIPLKIFQSVEELADYIIAGVFHCYGDKIPNVLFKAISGVLFTCQAEELAISNGSMPAVKTLFNCLDKYLIKNGSNPGFLDIAIDFSQFEELVASTQQKALSNLHLTQKVQERKVML